MDITENLGMWGILLIGVGLGAGLVFVTLVPSAWRMGIRQGIASQLRTGDSAAEGHPPVRLEGGPADGLHVMTPQPLCSRIGLRIDIQLVDEDTHLISHYTYTIVEPHLARHTPEEGDDA